MDKVKLIKWINEEIYGCNSRGETERENAMRELLLKIERGFFDKEQSQSLEVCCRCYYEGVESGQLDGDVWCPRCEEWIARSVILPKEEVLRLRKETKKRRDED